MIRRTCTAITCCLAASCALAGPVTPGTTSLILTGTDYTNHWAMNPGNVQYDNTGAFDFSVGTQNAGSFAINNLQVTGNIDPVISVSFDLTNNTASPQNYYFTFTLPVAALGPATVTGGSTGITITDSNGGGVSASDALPSHAFYAAVLDGTTTVATLDLLDPALTAGNFLTTTNNGSFGNPIPSLVSPAVSSSIGIEYRLRLSPGDRAAITGVFNVQQVPEPTSLALLALGGALIAARRRRSN